MFRRYGLLLWYSVNTKFPPYLKTCKSPCNWKQISKCFGSQIWGAAWESKEPVRVEHIFLSGIGNMVCPSLQCYLLRQSFVLVYSRTKWLQSTSIVTLIFFLGFYFSVYSPTRITGGYRKVVPSFRTILQKISSNDLNQMLLTLNDHPRVKPQ